MSFDEFVALRQRGLSRVHLNRITKDRGQEEEKKEDYPNTQEDVNLNVVVQKPDKIIDLLSAFGAPPMSEVSENEPSKNTLYYSSSEMNFNGKSNVANYTNYEEPKILTRDQTMATSDHVDGIIIRRTGLEGQDKRLKLTSLRSTIIAIAVIFGITVAAFVVIYSICKIRQKQNYMSQNAFSRTVFQTPIMPARKLSNSSSLNTIMVNVVTTAQAQNMLKSRAAAELGGDYEFRCEMENDSLDANDSWRSIPDFMK